MYVNSHEAGTFGMGLNKKNNANKSSWRICLTIVCWVLSLSGCRYFQERPIADEAIARVGETYLYRSQLKEMLAISNQTDQDSVEIAKYHIKQWAITQLLSNVADSISPDRLAFIDQQVTDYRKSLLRYEAERQLAQPDTTIADTLIENYYKNNTDQWLLKDHLLQASYMIIRKEAMEQYVSKQLFFKADTDTVFNYLSQYCAQYGYRCMLQPKWLTWSELNQIMPLPEKNTAEIIKKSDYETIDSLYIYRLKIHKRNPIGTTAPLDYCMPQIRDAILHSRRLESTQALLQARYQKAIEDDIIKIY